MSNADTRPALPQSPAATTYRPEVYQAFADLLASRDVIGVGANVWDLEIFRLACCEKIRRDGPLATAETGFVASFIAHIRPPWAAGLVTFWHEGLGPGWNLLVNDDAPSNLLARILFRPYIPFVFALFKIPVRLPGFDCEIHDDYTICMNNDRAPLLSADERAIWEREAYASDRLQGIESPTPIKWNIPS